MRSSTDVSPQSDVHPLLMPWTTKAPMREEIPMSTHMSIAHQIKAWIHSIVFAGAAVYSPELAVALLPPRG